MDFEMDDGAGPSRTTINHVQAKIESTSIGTNSAQPTRKRRYSSTDIGPSVKVFIRSSNSSLKSPLLNLSDEVLLEILQYCNSETLDTLSKTCQRFQYLVCDRKLWQNFDFSSTPSSADEITRKLKYVNKKTKCVKIKGLVGMHPLDKWRNNTLTQKMLQDLSCLCPNLVTLALYEAYLNLEKIGVANFPKTLTKLIIHSCQINQSIAPKAFFDKIDCRLVHLEELELENCCWFDSHNLIILSKLPHLKKLNLKGCKKLMDFVPYGSIATRFGFRSLEVLDVRDTPIADSDIQCFNITRTLREIFMECPVNFRESGRSITIEPICNYPHLIIPYLGAQPVQAQPPEPEHRPEPEQQPEPEQHPEQDQQQQQPEQEQQLPVEQEVADEPIQILGNVPAQDVQPQLPMDNLEREDRNHILDYFVQSRRDRGDFRAADNGLPGEQQPPMRHYLPDLIIIRGRDNAGADAALDARRNRISWQVVDNRHFRHPNVFDPIPVPLVTDRGICSYGLPAPNAQDGIVRIIAEARYPNTLIEKLVVRHYKLVTDISLRHLAHSSPKLVLLDVTGTSVTEDGVRIFKMNKPQCTVISNFDNAV